MTAAAKPLSRSKWLALRATRLGGTDVARIAGLDPDHSNLDVYNEKLGLTPPQEENSYMERGRVLEPVVARLYTARTGRKLRKTPVLFHPEFPFLMGTPDREFVDLNGLVEIKTHGYKVFETVRTEGLFPRQIAQLQWYLGLKALLPGPAPELGAFALLCPDLWDLIAFDVVPDPDLFASLLDLALRFQRDHLDKKVPPPLVDAPQVNITPVGDAKVIDDATIVAALALYAEAKKVVDEAESALTMAKDSLRAVLPGQGAYKLPGATIQYVTEPGRKTLDRAALIAHGIDPTQFERQGAPYQKFTVYLKKERK